jgi:hypothetical protein
MSQMLQHFLGLPDKLRLALQEESQVEEGRMISDHLQVFSIRLKYSLAHGVHQGQGSDPHRAQQRLAAEELLREELLARGYYASAASKEEVAVRDCIKRQEQKDLRIDQLAIL